MSHFFSNINTRKKFIFSIMLFSLVPFLLIMAGILSLLNHSADSLSKSDIQALACSQANHLETQIDIIENLHFQIRNNLAWINLFSVEPYKSTEAAGAINLILQQSAVFNDIGLAIYSADQSVKQFGNSDVPFDQGWLQELSLISDQQEISWKTREDWIYAAQLLPEEPQFEKSIAVIGLPIQRIKSNFDIMPQNYGYSILNAREEVVYQNKSALNETVGEPALNQVESRIIFSIGEDVTTCINSKAWQIIIFHPSKNITNNGYTSYLLIIAGGIVLVFLAAFSLIINKNFLLPIQKIARGFQAINQGQLEDFKPLDLNEYKGETGVLIQEINNYLALTRSIDLKEKALRQSEERFSLALRGANDGIWDWELKENFCYYSPRWRYMLGYTEESVRNTPSEWFTRVHPDDLDELKADMNAHLEGNTPHFENEHRLRHMNGNYIWVLARGLALRNTNGKAYRFAGSIGDISKRKAYETRLLKDAMHDPLTNLPNNAFFKEALRHSLSRMQRRDDYYAAVLLIDLDHFKSIIDELGYDAGDLILNEISNRLVRSLRSIDTIARSNGDEFAILLEEINGLHDAIRVTQRIQKDIIAPIRIENKTFSINASIGIVILTRAYQDPLEILRDADTATFQAKANGRGRFEIFDKEMHAHSLSKLRIQEELELGINNEQFRIFYQPVIESSTGDIRFVEALLRWRHPEKGLINTENFIPLAEESGQISLLDKWILKNACLEAGFWTENGFDKLRVSINISPRLLVNPDFPEIIRTALADAGIASHVLVIEITESSAIYNSGIAIQNLFELNSLGIEICLDDFGLVESSLEQLKRLPVSTIKIAQSFIKDLPSNQDDAAICEAIISMAHILGMKVGCLGIENTDQMNFVQSKGCDYLQGYLFARPMDYKDLTRFLSEQSSKFKQILNKKQDNNQ